MSPRDVHGLTTEVTRLVAVATELLAAVRNLEPTDATAAKAAAAVAETRERMARLRGEAARG